RHMRRLRSPPLAPASRVESKRRRNNRALPDATATAAAMPAAGTTASTDATALRPPSLVPPFQSPQIAAQLPHRERVGRQPAAEEELVRLHVKLLDARTVGSQIGGRVDQRRNRRSLNDATRHTIECAMHRAPRFRHLVAQPTQLLPRTRE